MRFHFIFLVLISWVLISCSQPTEQSIAESAETSATMTEPYLVVLGIAQDAGYPQAACKKDCCKPVWEGQVPREMVSCLAFVDPGSAQSWIFDATPDFKDQLYHVQNRLGTDLSGIFLTHAHIGHYTGLMHLGREVMGANKMPIFEFSLGRTPINRPTMSTSRLPSSAILFKETGTCSVSLLL